MAGVQPDPPTASDDHPPASPPLRLPRGELCQQVLEDLSERGVAVLQGPGGSGTSWAAWELAQSWQGPVTWVRAGMWLHLADLARPLWPGEAPRALQGGPSEQVVDAILARLQGSGGLLVLDDLDPCFSSGVAGVPDPELRLLLAALEAGEMENSGAGVLITAHRGPRALSVPLRLLPPLSRDDAARIAGRSCASLPTAWLRRPGALALLPHLPKGAALPEDASHPWPELLTILAESSLGEAVQEVLLTLALARRPTPPLAICAAGGLRRGEVEGCLERLGSLGLAERIGESWRCSRYIASTARRLLPERLPGVLPIALMQRLGGYYLRVGQDHGHTWESMDQTATARIGLRYAVAAGDGRMALQAALHGGTMRVARGLRAWRSMRDDLRLALSVPALELDQEDIAQACLTLAEAAAGIGDHDTTGPALVRALPHAQAAGNPDLVRDIHTRLARHLLLSGSSRQSLEHLRAALFGAARAGDTRARCDLLGLSGSLHLQGGRLTKAQLDFESSLALALAMQDERRAASRRAGLGGVLIYRGRLRDAEVQLRLAAEQARECGDLIGLSHRLLNQSLVRSLRGDVRGAMACVAEAASQLPPGQPRLEARLLSLRGNLRRLAGDLSGAALDLDQSLDAANVAGDRDAVVEILGAQGHWHRCFGNFEQACHLFEEVLDNVSPEREDAFLAGRESDLWNATAWEVANRQLETNSDCMPELVLASDKLQKCHLRIPEEPFRVRYVSSALQLLEVQLLAATLSGVAPLAQTYRLEQLLDEDERDTELADTGSPALRALHAWALLLCARPDDARKEAERAALDAGMCGLATLRECARVLLGEEPQPWNGQAVLLQKLLHEARRGKPPPSDRGTGAIPLHGPREP
jgi:tetratricopeptide (TPR) repeat protein